MTTTERCATFKEMRRLQDEYVRKYGPLSSEDDGLHRGLSYAQWRALEREPICGPGCEDDMHFAARRFG